MIAAAKPQPPPRIEDDLRAEWARRLKAARLAAGMTQRELSEASGVSQPMISQIERWGREPRAVVALRLATALGLDAVALFPFRLPEPAPRTRRRRAS